MTWHAMQKDGKTDENLTLEVHAPTTRQTKQKLVSFLA